MTLAVVNLSDPVIEIGLPVASLACWVVLYVTTVLASRPTVVTPGAAVAGFPGQEPPAVVNLLANGWRQTGDAAQSTLLDLAARRYLELRQADPDSRTTTVHLTGRAPDDLNPYERQVYDRVAERAVEGVVPLAALNFSDAAWSTDWSTRLRHAVVADARRLGVSRPRVSRPLVTLLRMLGVVAAGGVAVGSWHYVTRSGGDRLGAGAAFVVTAMVLAAIAGRDLGERDTPAGRAAAARWLGLRARLAGHAATGDLPPAAVTAGDRYLAYACALGRTSSLITFGVADRGLLWSSYGGRWRQVSVSYPGGLARYQAPLGRTAPTTVTGEVLWHEVWQRQPSDDGPGRPINHYLVIDDGHADRLRAWILPHKIADECRLGDIVTARVRPWSRRVLGVTVQRATP
ncbi:DUF2207 domain-containing protein [Micromonospora sp. WMMD710]|uniref:DUF2207 family protein n=1 Tax=Micromonospora sp. WMMD710 TaxID=3016085 RepID=UPI00241607AA|nr:DUF2207 domain-containing protein [Micromonospora sp. WMMD710]MDG4759467.1 DUF2207 domain-containing protein [Micromonospora sp. WMMD710]